MSQQGRNAKREGARSHELYVLQALNRIKDAITGNGNPPAPSGIATETTLQAVLAAVDSMRDYEVRLVTDSDSPEVTWLEVRYWDAQDGTLGAPQYYLPGSSTPGTPVGPISYIPTSTLLSQILAELQAIAGFYHIENDDDVIPVNLDLPTNINLLYGEYDSGEGTQWERIQIDSEGRLLGLDTIRSWIETLNAKFNSLGQKASAGSAPVVLSTEQEAILDSIKTAIENIDIDLGTGGLNLEATQLLVKAVLDTIKLDTAGILTNTADIEALLTTIDADTSNLDVALSTRATEATLLLVKGVLDSIKLDTAAIDANTDGLEALLTTIDAVLDAIKLDTANLDVALSTRATEATLLSVLTELQGINLDTNGLNQEATQLLVKGVLDTIDAVLDSIKLDTGAMVVDLAAIEVLITSTNSLLTTIDGVLDAIKVDTGNILLDTTAIKNAIELLDNTVGTDGVAHGASQQGVRALGTDGTNDQQLLTDANGRLQVDIVGGSTSGGALESTQLLVEAHVGNIETQLTAKSITPNLIRTAASGSIPSGSYSFTIANVGAADADILGGTNNLKAGETVSFDAGALNNTYGAIAYDATGTELLITYNS